MGLSVATLYSQLFQANNRVALARMDCDQIVTKIKKKNQQLLERSLANTAPYASSCRYNYS